MRVVEVGGGSERELVVSERCGCNEQRAASSQRKKREELRTGAVIKRAFRVA